MTDLKDKKEDNNKITNTIDDLGHKILEKTNAEISNFLIWWDF